jgi:ATP-dependent Zn protease
MTTHNGRGPVDRPGDAGLVGESAESTPAPEGDSRRPQAHEPDPRIRIAWHEAGHAVIRAVLVGGDVGVVSIWPGAAQGGVLIPTHDPAPEGSLPDGLPEVFDWPEGGRRHIQARAVVSLGGTIAEHLVPH